MFCFIALKLRKLKRESLDDVAEQCSVKVTKLSSRGTFIKCERVIYQNKHGEKRSLLAAADGADLIKANQLNVVRGYKLQFLFKLISP